MELADSFWKKQLAYQFSEVQLADPGDTIAQRRYIAEFKMPQEVASKLHNISGGNWKSLFVLLHASFSHFLSRVNYIDYPCMLVGNIDNSDRWFPFVTPLDGKLGFEQNVKNISGELLQADRFSFYAESSNFPLRTGHDQFRFSVVQSYPLEQHDSGHNFIMFQVNGSTIGYRVSLTTGNDHWEDLLGVQFPDLVRAALTNPQMPLNDIQPDTSWAVDCYHWHSWKDAEFIRDVTIDELVDRVCLQNKDRVALVDDQQSLTYGQLKELSDRASMHIKQQAGGTPGSPVAIRGERNVQFVVAMLGVLKAGYSYVPLEPGLPRKRQQYIQQNCGFSLIITDSVEPDEFELLVTAITFSQLATDLSGKPAKIHDASTQAYIIYTSGTTGQPKGVSISHGNVLQLITHQNAGFKFSKNDIWSIFHSFSFDFSVWEIFQCLATGGKGVIVSRLTARDPALFVKLLFDYGITVVCQTPTAFYSLANEVERSNRWPGVRTFIFGGEALDLRKLSSWKRADPSIQFVNMYGITETTVHVTFKELSEDEINSRSGLIGFPLAPMCVYVLDKNRRQVMRGAIGELFVGGHGVSHGYVNNPALTSERFIQNPYQPGEILYRTGDQVRILPDRELQFKGRIDRQVKIRGYRIELGEIESVARAHNSVSEAYASVDEDTIIINLVFKKAHVSKDELYTFFKERLPGHMLPSLFYQLSRIPRSLNGKIDVDSLRSTRTLISDGEGDSIHADQFFTDIARLWRESLNITSIRVSDDYFSSGGDSIKALSLIVAVSSLTGREVSISDLFQYPRLGDFASYVAKEAPRVTSSKTDPYSDHFEGIKQRAIVAIEKQAGSNDQLKNIEDILPLADIQAAMIFHSLKDTTNAVYHDQFVFSINVRDFSLDQLNAALNGQVEKNPMLRTYFDTTCIDVPVQVVLHSYKYSIEQIDLVSDGNESINQLMEADRRNSFLDRKLPPWRLALLKKSDNERVVLFTFHHALMDGWSVATFLSRLTRDYVSLVDRTPGTMRPASSYKEFLIDQCKVKADDKFKDFWTSEIQGFAQPTLLFNREGRPFRSGRKQMASFALPRQLTDSIREKALDAMVGVKSIYLSAFVKLLSLLSGEQTISFLLVANARPAVADSEKILGCFLNSVPFTASVDHTMPGQLLHNVDAKYKQIKTFDRYPLNDILNTTRLNDKNLKALFNYNNFHVYGDLHERVVPGTVPVGGYENTDTWFDFSVIAAGGDARVLINYIDDYFEPDEIAAFQDYYIKCLEWLTRDKFSFLDENQYALLSKQHNWDSWKNSKVHYNTIAEAFGTIVNRMSNAIAIRHSKSILTYTDLNIAVDKLAKRISEATQDGDLSPIPIVATPGFGMITAILAVLKLDRPYVPIDADYPDHRKNFIIDDCRSKLVLTCEALTGNVSIQTIVNVSQTKASCVPSDAPAYIIYTSGTTGEPKGVVVSHENVLQLVFHQPNEFDFREGDVWTLFHSTSFDFSVWEIFGCLLNGGTLVVVDKVVARDPTRFCNLLESEKVTVLSQTPTAFYSLSKVMNLGNLHLPMLRYVVFGGEKLNVGSLKYWMSKHPGAKPINMYGITETTVHVTFKEIFEQDVLRNRSSIGLPLSSYSVYVLGADMQPVMPHCVGQIYVGGYGIAIGYHNRAELTSKRFIANPFNESERLYFSGDRCRVLGNGELEYIGRGDNQVKVRGYRIEPREIEELILKYPSISNVVVFAEDNDLSAYLVIDHSAIQVDFINHIRRYLAAYLPEFMIPTSFYSVPSMPYNINGKLDLNELTAAAIKLTQHVQLDSGLTTIERELLSLLRLVVGDATVQVSQDLREFGLNSIRLLEFNSMLYEKLGARIPIHRYFEMETLSIRELGKVIETERSTTISVDDIIDDIAHSSGSETEIEK